MVWLSPRFITTAVFMCPPPPECVGQSTPHVAGIRMSCVVCGLVPVETGCQTLTLEPPVNPPLQIPVSPDDKNHSLVVYRVCVSFIPSHFLVGFCRCVMCSPLLTLSCPATTLTYRTKRFVLQC